MKKSFILVLLLSVFFVVSLGFAEEKTAGEIVKDAGQGVSDTAKEVGGDIEKEAQAVEKDVKEGAKDASAKGKEVGDDSKKGAEDVGKGIKEGAKDAGK